MTNRLCVFWGLTLTLIGASSCEKVAGIEKKELVAAGGSGPNSVACSAVSSDGVGIRVANMIPGDTKVDLCVRPAGGQFPSQPMLMSGGANCPSGVGYTQYSVPLKVSPGTYDVKLVPSGSDCGVAGITASGVVVRELPTNLKTISTTVVAAGSDFASADATAVALSDTTTTGTNVYIRFFNALNGAGPVNVGLLNSNTTPPIVSPTVFSDVPFGHISSPTTTGLSVDDFGYMLYGASTTGVAGLAFGGAIDQSSNQAVVQSFVSLKNSHHYTLFLIGSVGTSSTHPPKFWSCDESQTVGNGYFATCGAPVAVSMGVFQPNLTDIFTDYIDERMGAALTAIAGSKTQVLCLPELYSPAVRSQLSAAAANSTIYFSDSATASPLTDLTDQTGATPVYKDPACSGDYQLALLNVEKCLTDPTKTKDCIGQRTTDPSDTKHYFLFRGSQAIGCAAKYCQTEFSAFVFAQTHEADACMMCLVAHLSSDEAIEDAYTRCTTSNNAKPHFVFDGSTGLAVLTTSDVTLAAGDAPEVVDLPSSTWKRAALRVPLKIADNGTVIDFWCASIRAANGESFMPNGGPYYGLGANGQPNPAGISSSEVCNAAEERLQISRLISAVNAHAASSNRRAVIAALTYTSPQIGQESNPTIAGSHTENFALFSAAPWAELTAPGYAPQCTFCGDNPLNDPTSNEWTQHLFAVGFAPEDVDDTTITFKDKSVTLTLYGTTDPVQTPVSQYYGLQSTVRVTQ